MDSSDGKSVADILGSGKFSVNSSGLMTTAHHSNLDSPPSVTSITRTVKIPKELMQTWKTTTLPPKWAPSQRSIRTLMPSWNYTLMTDEDNLKFVETHFPDFVFFFKSFEYPIQRADAIRYMWLYVKGGLYIDLDLEIVKPLDDLFFEDKDLYVVKSSIMPNVYTNAFMGAKPRLPIMLRCLEEMKAPYAYWHLGKHLKVVNSTGPNMFTKSIQKEIASSYDEDGTLVKRKLEVTELPGDLIIACSICDPKPCCTEGGYCRLLGGSSWSEGDTEFWTSIYCNRRELVVVFILLVIIIAAVLIVYRKKLWRRNRY